MAGPQFMRIQSYSCKANPAGQSVEQVLEEADREPEFSKHIEAPEPPRIVFGLSPKAVRKKHDAMVAAGHVDVTLKGGKKVRRGIRKDRHSLLTFIASHPNLTSQMQADAESKKAYEAWVAYNLRYLQSLFGDRLVSMIEHTDESHPHLHAYILPLNDPSCSARDLNPAWRAKTAAEAKARAEGHEDRVAVKMGDQAYRARARQMQDEYHAAVGMVCGLTRTGPKRERLSRQQWTARKEAATRDASLQRQLDDRVASLAEREEALDAEAQATAEKLAARLDELENFLAEADKEKAEVLEAASAAAAEKAAIQIEAAEALLAEAQLEKDRFAAERQALAAETNAIRQDARNKAKALQEFAQEAVRMAQLEAKTIRESAEADAKAKCAALQTDRRLFDAEKGDFHAKASTEAAKATVEVVLGVLRGDVRMKPDGRNWSVSDASLAERLNEMKLGNLLREVVKIIFEIWNRLTTRLSATEQKAEIHHVEAIAAPPPPMQGPTP